MTSTVAIAAIPTSIVFREANCPLLAGVELMPISVVDLVSQGVTVVIEWVEIVASKFEIANPEYVKVVLLNTLAGQNCQLAVMLYTPLSLQAGLPALNSV